LKVGQFRERKRDTTIEGVRPKAKPAKITEVRNSVGKGAGESKARKPEVGDVAVDRAGDATPVTRRRRSGRVPGGEDAKGVVEVELEGSEGGDLRRC